MIEKDDIELDEAALQMAWEQTLRGEDVASGAIDKANLETAEILRDYVMWEAVRDEPVEINKQDRQKMWEKLAPQILPKEDNLAVSEATNLQDKTIKKIYWWIGIAVVFSITAFAVVRKVPKSWLPVIGIGTAASTTATASDDKAQESDKPIFKQKKVDNPIEYGTPILDDPRPK